VGAVISTTSLAGVALVSWLWTSSAAQTLELGSIVDPVPCAGDPSQTYALYLPSSYAPERQWSVLLAFHPAARGRQMVETYRAAAEAYGYIVASSNNARNGPHSISAAAAQAMSTDVGRRFSIDSRRIYLAGMSGGARVALGLALANAQVAGVVASSAGFPDSQPRDEVSFAIFGTAGTADFNYVEMRRLSHASAGRCRHGRDRVARARGDAVGSTGPR
jgi:poly(3-hydroxybutyrate) depolymerase